jgi:hypothetical protein
MPAPKNVAINVSRIKPRIRLINVMLPIVNMD